MKGKELKSDYEFDMQTGEALGHCQYCRKSCVYTDNFGRDNCIKLVDEIEQTPEVIGLWCSIDCFWDDLCRQVNSRE